MELRSPSILEAMGSLGLVNLRERENTMVAIGRLRVEVGEDNLDRTCGK